MARATNSLPVPVAPAIMTVVIRGATSRVRRYSFCMTSALPIIPGKRATVLSCGYSADRCGRIASTPPEIRHLKISLEQIGCAIFGPGRDGTEPKVGDAPRKPGDARRAGFSHEL